MPFIFPINNQLKCSAQDELFRQDIAYLLDLTGKYLVRIKSGVPIDIEMITSLGNSCLDISKTITNDRKNDLFDQNKYKDYFVGQHSEKFIEIMKLVQDLWHTSSELDTYPTLELLDKGVRPGHREHFQRTLELLHNKLLIIDQAIKNRE